MRTIAKEDAFAFELCEKLRAGGAEIRKQEISCAGKSEYTEFLQSVRKSFARALYIADVRTNGLSVAECGFSSHKRGDIYGKRRHGATDKSERVFCSDDCT